MHNNLDKTILVLSLPLAGLIITCSCVGLLTPDFYYPETLNWQLQALGQDAINLFLVTPLLIIGAILATRQNKTAFSLWAGANLYLVYTFVIYCFDVHFNKLFIFYCLLLGLSFYSFLYFVFSKKNEHPSRSIYSKVSVKVISVYFITISCLFYILWFSEIIPAIIIHSLPESLAKTGLATNPVHVIDLSVFLPGIFITGILLLMKKPLALLFAPVILLFFVLMDITIGTLDVAMKINKPDGDYTLAFIMSLLSIFSIILLVGLFKVLKREKTFITPLSDYCRTRIETII